MKTLLELVRIISKSKARYIEVLGRDTNSNHKVIRLYHLLSSGKARTDVEAMRYLYGDNPKSSSYRNLKSSLRKRLLNSVLFINLAGPSLNEREKAYYNCQKEWAAVKVLLRIGACDSAIKLAKKTLKQALRFDLTEIVVQASQALRFHYGTRLGDLKKMREYGQIHKKYLKAWQFEALAEEYYALLVANYTIGHSVKAEASCIAWKYYERLESAMVEFQTCRLFFMGYLIRVIAYRSANDYQNTVESCQQAIRAFEAKGYEVKAPIFTFLHHQILAQIQLKHYKEAECAACQAVQMLPAGTANWFINMDLLLILSLHTRQYQRAYQVYQEAVGHKGFRKLQPASQEQWYINGAYIHFLLEIGQANAVANNGQARKFRLNRFLNEVPACSRDKQGMNIPVLIIQMLFLIVKKRYGPALGRIDALKKYRARYLHKVNALNRSNYFIMMLLEAPRCNFHKAAVQRHTEKYYEQLKTLPTEVANQECGIEIIPYEDLWAFVLESLD